MEKPSLFRARRKSPSITLTDSRSGAVLDRVFERFPVRIGRSALGDLQLDFGFISQFHAVIEKGDQTVFVRDLGSRNGTAVAGQRITPHQKIELGQGNLAFEIGPLKFQGILGTAEKRAGSEQTAVMMALSEDPATRDATQVWEAFVAEPPQQRVRDPRDVALQALRNLARTYVPEANPLDDAESVVRFVGKLKQSLDLLFGAFIPLRDGARQIQMHETTEHEDPEWAAIANAKSASAIAARTLDWRTPSTEALRAIQNTFADFVIHQVAVVDGVVRGTRALLHDISPASIEARAEKKLFGREGAAFRAYVERYKQLVDEGGNALTTLFGEHFVRAYRQQGGDPTRSRAP